MYLGTFGLLFLLGGIALMNYHYSIIGFGVSIIGIILMNKGYKNTKK